MEKSVERSIIQDQHGGKDDSRKVKKRSVAAFSKVGAARCTSKDKLVGIGDRLDKSQQQSNLKQVSKLPQVPMTKRKLQKTTGAGPGPKAPSVTNSRGKNQVTESAPRYNLRSKVQKTEDQNASINIQNSKAPKKHGSNDSSLAIPKSGILKNSAKPVTKMETTKHLTASLADLDKMKNLLISQHEPFSRKPIYHIRWKDEDVGKGPLGQNCILCNKDLSRATEDDDSEYSDEDEDDNDDDYDVDEEYYNDLNPLLLPAVDILSCGHAYHTECLQNNTPKEQLSDPRCVFCYKMS